MNIAEYLHPVFRAEALSRIFVWDILLLFTFTTNLFPWLVTTVEKGTM